MTRLAWFDTALLTRVVVTFGHFLWQGAAIALIVLVLSVVVRDSSARLRYVFFLAALMLMTICPFVTFWFVEAGESGSALAQPGEPTLAGESDTRTFLSDEIANVRTPADGIGILPLNEILAADTRPGRIGASSSEQATLSSGEAQAGSRWQWAVPYLTVVYLLGVLSLLGRLLLGLHGGHHLRRQSKLVDEPALLVGIARSAKVLGMRFTPTVLYCKQIAIPTVVGVFRPAILLPLSLTTGLSPDQVEAVLTHELAHVRRYDHLVNILQRVIESLLFFHPAVWWVSHLIRVERENCCDDIVVALGAEPLRYAACLLEIADRGRASWPGPQLETVAALHMTKSGSLLSRRIRRLVSGSSSETLRLTRGGLVLTLACLALVVSGAMLLRGQTESKGSIRETREQKKDEPTNAGGKATFGPVIERTLSCGQDDSKPFLRLESGQLVAKPTERNAMDEATVLSWMDWMEQNDVDVGLVKTRGELQLLCCDPLAVYQLLEPEIVDRYWNRMTADEFMELLSKSAAGILPFESRHFVSLIAEKTPITFYFPGRGLLQVTEVKAGKPATVKIRYKLVPNNHTQNKANQTNNDVRNGPRALLGAVEADVEEERQTLLYVAAPIIAHGVKLEFANPNLRDGSFHSEQSVAFVLNLFPLGQGSYDHMLIGQTTWGLSLEKMKDHEHLKIHDGTNGQAVIDAIWPANDRFSRTILLSVTYGERKYSCPTQLELERVPSGKVIGDYWFCGYLSGSLPLGAGGRRFEIVNLDQQMEFRNIPEGDKPDAVLGVDVNGDGKIDPAPEGKERFELYEPFQIRSRRYVVTEVDPYLPRVVFREVASHRTGDQSSASLQSESKTVESTSGMKTTNSAS